MDIVYLLRGGSSSVRRIAIFGEEGVEQTTLARNAYNHPLVVEHFEVRAWSTISGEFDLPRMIGELLRSMGAETGSNSYNMRRLIGGLLCSMGAETGSNSSNTEDELIQSLCERLRGKRYLIVVDNASDYKFWERVRDNMRLPDDDNGSRMMLTTTDYASVKFVDNMYRMPFMDECKAWDMLQYKIFKREPCPSHLEYVGKMIAASFTRCSPAIGVISGILAANQTEAAWRDILQKSSIASESGNIYDSKLSRMLSLGYTYLPHHLRPCFLYLAMFREFGKGIRVSKLVKLWVAEGFLDESECRSFEETGEELVEDLLRRNLVSGNYGRKYDGRIKTIYIDDYVLNACIRHARMENFLLYLSKLDRRALDINPQVCRRVSGFTYGGDFLGGVYGSTVRAIMLDEGRLPIIRWSIGNARLLRILDLSNAYNHELPEEVFELFHLRYLAFHSGFSISEAISNLENLQTLIICPRENDGDFANLPEGIWRMAQLRHLSMFRFELASHKGATSPLENLQTLSQVVDFMCSRRNLEMIPNLKKLALFHTKSFIDCELHNLIYLHKLEILKIEMDWSFGGLHKMSCAFPPTLGKLDLCGLQLPWEDMKIVAALPNLAMLKLRKLACIGETWETSEGGFTQLTYLLIVESNLENWIVEASHFPRLEDLVLRDCWCLNEFPTDMGRVPALKYVELDKKNQSLWNSAIRIKEDLRQSLGYNDLYVFSRS